MSLSVLRYANWMNATRGKAYPCIFLFVYAFIIALWLSGSPLIPKHDGVEVARDFVNVYAAGIAVHEGHPAQVYDWNAQKNREHQIEQSGQGPTPAEEYVPWLYPPMFLGVAWLVAFLPYYAALAAYLGAGFAAYSVSVYKLTRLKNAQWAITAFPGVCGNLFVGQNGFITTALLAAGLLVLDETPLLAGVAFGALSYKPQFFVLIPLALFVGRYWKALAATLVSAGICCGASLAAFGAEPWKAFFNGLPAARTAILEDPTDRWFGIMHTVFSLVRMFGGSLQIAYALQTIVAIFAVVFLLWVWSRRFVPLSVRGATLAAVLLLASPYSFNYDQVILALPLALLAREGIRNGFLPYEKIFLCILWLLPFLIKDYGEHYAVPLTPPMLVGILFFCWKRAINSSLVRLESVAQECR